MSATRYEKPPVVEALCELFFADSHWDDTLPGCFYERVRAHGFGKESSQGRGAEHLVRFASKQHDRVLQLGRDLVVVNQLAPYPGFEAWRPTILQAGKIYSELARPTGLRRVGLRYINRITLPGMHVVLERYFTVAPRIPAAWNEEHGPFLVRLERKLDDESRLILTFGSAPGDQPRSMAFLLDGYGIADSDGSLPLAHLDGTLERLHAGLEQMFESSITDELRSRFEAESRRP